MHEFWGVVPVTSSLQHLQPADCPGPQFSPFVLSVYHLFHLRRRQHTFLSYLFVDPRTYTWYENKACLHEFTNRILASSSSASIRMPLGVPQNITFLRMVKIFIPICLFPSISDPECSSERNQTLRPFYCRCGKISWRVACLTRNPTLPIF